MGRALAQRGETTIPTGVLDCADCVVCRALVRVRHASRDAACRVTMVGHTGTS